MASLPIDVPLQKQRAMDFCLGDVYNCYPSWFLEGLQELRTEGHLVDVTLCAEGREIPCHRLVLSALTDYFKAMFGGSHSESMKDKIEIGGVSAEALQEVVDYAYTGKMNITANNVQSLLEAANMLQVLEMIRVCEIFLADRLSVDQCLGSWMLADKLSSTHLSEAARAFAMKNFDELCRTEDFLQLPVDLLKTYISDKDLHVKEEEKVLEAIMLWARHDLDRRERHLKELFECVCFSRMDQTYVKNMLKNDKVLARVRGIKKLIKKQSLDATPRRILQEEILLLGGVTWDDEGEEVHPFMYNLDLQCNYVGADVLPRSLQKSKGIVACVLKNDVIVTGGDRSRRQVWRYSPSLKAWTKLACLKTGRVGHGMTVLHGQVYVAGGQGNGDRMVYIATVEVYSERTNSWEMRAPLLEAVSNFGISTCNGKIYVFGGEAYLCHDTKALQCYDPTQNVWTYASPLPQPMPYLHLQACTVDSKIYMVGGQLKNVLCYDPQEDQYKVMAEQLIYWDDCSASVCGSEIIITGGCGRQSWHMYDDSLMPDDFEFASHSTVQCFNVKTGILTRGEDLPVALHGHYTVTIPKC